MAIATRSVAPANRYDLTIVAEYRIDRSVPFEMSGLVPEIDGKLLPGALGEIACFGAWTGTGAVAEVEQTVYHRIRNGALARPRPGMA